MNYDYSFYLFCKLRDLIIPTDMAYDLQHTEDVLLFEEYLNSKFNVDTKGEYECIQDFLHNHKNK